MTDRLTSQTLGSCFGGSPQLPSLRVQVLVQSWRSATPLVTSRPSALIYLHCIERTVLNLRSYRLCDVNRYHAFTTVIPIATKKKIQLCPSSASYDRMTFRTYTGIPNNPAPCSSLSPFEPLQVPTTDLLRSLEQVVQFTSPSSPFRFQEQRCACKELE